MLKIDNFKCRNNLDGIELMYNISIRGYAQKFMRTHRWPLGLVTVTFLGFPDEKPSFLDFENNWLRTDGPTDGRTDPLIEMRGRI